MRGAVGVRQGTAGAPGEASSRVATPLDLRLLIPAAVTWSLLVVLLGLPVDVFGLPVDGVGPCVAAAVCGVTVALLAVGVRRTARERRRRDLAAVVALTGLVTGLVMTAAAAHLAIRSAGPLAELAAERSVVTLHGRIEEDPRALATNARRPEPVYAARLLVTEVVARGSRTSVRTPVLLLGDAQLQSLHWREKVRVSGRLSAAESADRVVALVRVTGDVEREQSAGVVAQVAEHARSRLREAVEPLPPDARGLVPALVIGDRSLTPAMLTDDMKATGMTHLTAVSGRSLRMAMLVPDATRYTRFRWSERIWTHLESLRRTHLPIDRCGAHQSFATR